MRRFKFSHLVLIALTSFLLAFLSGCGGGDSSKSDGSVDKGPPTPTSPRQIESSGTSIFSFGAGAGRGSPGADDEEYQEYLLWKEWQQYLKYKQWLRDQGKSPSE